MHKIVSFCIAFDMAKLQTIFKTPKIFDIFYSQNAIFCNISLNKI